MNIIQLERMEEEDMEVMNRDIHQVMRLFRDEEAHSGEQESELAKEVVEIYEQFIGSKEYYQYIAMKRDEWLFNDKMEEHFEEGLIEGEAKGKEKGLVEGKIDALKTIVQEIYCKDNLLWLDNCTLKQVDIGLQLVIKRLDYEEFKNMIVES